MTPVGGGQCSRCLRGSHTRQFTWKSISIMSIRGHRWTWEEERRAGPREKERETLFPVLYLPCFSSLKPFPQRSGLGRKQTSAVDHDKQSASLPFVSPLKTAVTHEEKLQQLHLHETLSALSQHGNWNLKPTAELVLR